MSQGLCYGKKKWQPIKSSNEWTDVYVSALYYYDCFWLLNVDISKAPIFIYSLSCDEVTFFENFAKNETIKMNAYSNSCTNSLQEAEVVLPKNHSGSVAIRLEYNGIVIVRWNETILWLG